MDKIQIFKTGVQTPTEGDALNADANFMRDVVNAYNTAKHEAPVVIGHPKHTDPAYAWVKALSLNEAKGVLYADFSQVDPQFKQMLESGRFKKRSASFYPPNHSQNPTPGKWYLRHVGFLGAQPPAVKGLKDFADDADCPTFDFAEPDLQKPTVGTGHALSLPTQSLTNEEKTMSDKDKIPDAKPPKEGEQTADFAEKQAQIDKERAALDAREAAIAKREKALADAQAEKQKKGFADFCDTLIATGRIAPAEKDAVVSAFIFADNSDQTFDFAEQGKVHKKSAVDVLKEVLSRSEPVVDFSERSASDPDDAGRPSYGESESQQDDKLHKAICDFAEKKGITYTEAVQQFDGEI